MKYQIKILIGTNDVNDGLFLVAPESREYYDIVTEYEKTYSHLSSTFTADELEEALIMTEETIMGMKRDNDCYNGITLTDSHKIILVPIA